MNDKETAHFKFCIVFQVENVISKRHEKHDVIIIASFRLPYKEIDRAL